MRVERCRRFQRLQRHCVARQPAVADTTHAHRRWQRPLTSTVRARTSSARAHTQPRTASIDTTLVSSDAECAADSGTARRSSPPDADDTASSNCSNRTSLIYETHTSGARAQVPHAYRYDARRSTNRQPSHSASLLSTVKGVRALCSGVVADVDLCSLDEPTVGAADARTSSSVS
jgi:hypothetical protein